MKSQELKANLLRKSDKDEGQTIRASDILSTGSTLVNLALTGKPGGGFVKGLAYRYIGTSGSGKTWFTLTCMAEAAMNPNFSDYRFIFDNAENGALMNIRRYFGKTVARKLEPPAGSRKDPVFSTTVEEFYYHVDDAVKVGKPFIYVLDSMDALDTEADEDKFRKDKAANRSGEKEGGSYGTSKAKLNGKMRTVVNALRDSGSILVMISQAKDDIGYGKQAGAKTYSGGTALRFYAHVELWTSVVKPILKTVHGKPRKVGAEVRIEVKKNRTEGWEGSIVVPFFKKYGIDDTGSLVDYLVEEKHWKGNSKEGKKPSKITAPELDFSGGREQLVQLIQEDEREQEVRVLAANTWAEVEDQCLVKRKPRYE